MRTGAYTIHQSLTAEAAAVLKLALSLARRRGHAQATPLHVAFTLLSSSSSSLPIFSSNSTSPPSRTYSLLKRACLKSSPSYSAVSHPLHCRALELCFNVALNRLPTVTVTSTTSSPPSSTSSNCSSFSSTSLIHPNPTLSNALIAALKRAQANQRRGCIELQQQQETQRQPQQQQCHQHQQQQQQPLLAIKVELDQLIISILDDPSVSRVMREAGFSSTTIKSNLEEECALLLGHSSSSSVSSIISPPFFFDSYNKDRTSSIHANLWPSQFIKPNLDQNQLGISSQKEDLKVILDVMVRKLQGNKRSNPVVVGDSISMAEGLVGELLRRMERGLELPEELKGAHLVRLQLSYVHLRLMSKSDVEVKLAELKRSCDAVVVGGSSCTNTTNNGALVIYVGDLKWAIVDDDKVVAKEADAFSAVEHMIAELGKLVSELKDYCSSTRSSSKVWLVATASYQTYMRCQKQQPSLEALWGLQAVMVPTGGLALSLQAPSSSMETKSGRLTHNPVKVVEPKGFGAKEEEENLYLCIECSHHFEQEASVLKPQPEGSNNSLTQLPCWLQPDKPEILYKENLIELRRKWSRLCQRLHRFHNNLVHSNPSLFSPYAPSYPWCSNCPPANQNKLFLEPHSASLTDTNVSKLKIGGGVLSFANLVENGKGMWPEREKAMQWPSSQVSLSPLKKEPASQDVRTTLALGSLLFSDSATSECKQKCEGSEEFVHDLEKSLQRNIPWQSGKIGSIVEALVSCTNGKKKGIWLLMQGNDHVAKRRAALVITEVHCGSSDKLISIDSKKLTSGGSLCSEIFTEAIKKDQKNVILIENIDQASTDFVTSLATLKNPFTGEVDLSGSIIILTTSSTTTKPENSVINLKLSVQELSSEDPKRKAETELPSKPKRPRNCGNAAFDLNIRAGEDEEEEEEIPSDITQEGDNGKLEFSNGLTEFIASRITLDFSQESRGQAAARIRKALVEAFEEAMGGNREATGEICIDEEVVEELMMASAGFLEGLFEKWVKEVFQIGVGKFKKGGKVRLGLGVGLDEGEKEDFVVMQTGFMGSVLPNWISVN